MSAAVRALVQILMLATTFVTFRHGSMASVLGGSLATIKLIPLAKRAVFDRARDRMGIPRISSGPLQFLNCYGDSSLKRTNTPRQVVPPEGPQACYSPRR